MNEENTLTTNIEADPPGYRPAKKKKPAANTAAASAARAKANKAKKPGKSSTPAKKSGKKPTHKAGVGDRKKVGKSSKPSAPKKTPRSGAATRSAGAKKGKKPGKPLSAKAISTSGTTSGGKGKKPGKSSPKTGKTGPVPSTDVTSTKRTYTKRLPEGVDIAALKPAKEYGISRIEQETKKNFGYYVRVGPPGGRRSIFFADKKHGSPAKALKAATEKRNELFEALPDWYKVRASKKRKVA